MRLHRLLILLILVAPPHLGFAQDVAAPAPEHDHPLEHQASTPGTWAVSFDANAFFGFNYQQRRFLDYSAWESQNWLMASATRPLGSGRLTLDGMLSLERFTLPRQGSPQLFQTGESYQQVPLVN